MYFTINVVDTKDSVHQELSVLILSKRLQSREVSFGDPARYQFKHARLPVYVILLLPFRRSQEEAVSFKFGINTEGSCMQIDRENGPNQNFTKI